MISSIVSEKHGYLLANLVPDNASHLITVHLNNGIGDLDLLGSNGNCDREKS